VILHQIMNDYFERERFEYWLLSIGVTKGVWGQSEQDPISSFNISPIQIHHSVCTVISSLRMLYLIFFIYFYAPVFLYTFGVSISFRSLFWCVPLF